MYDLIIIGGGPAGMTAGIYAARKKLKTLLLSKDMGGQMKWSNDIENYAGFSMVTGVELTNKFKEHLEHIKEDLEIKEGVEVIGLEKHITTFAVQEKSGQLQYGRSIIIATGKEPKHLGIPGEKEYFGKGVCVCATCDAPLYKNKDVVVIGGGSSAMDALYTLSKIARKVYCVNSEPNIHGDEILKTKISSQPNITFYNSARALEILGSKTVGAVNIRTQHNQEFSLTCDGVFVEIGYTPCAEFDTLTEKNTQGEIKVDGNLQTSVPGIFAAGDINDAWGDQIIIAAGEGAKAALAAAHYLHRN